MKIRDHNELEVFKMAFNNAMKIYELSKNFPKEEKYSLTDQIRRASRSVATNIAEAFRKRRYPKAFISKLSDSEAESAETQVWLRFSYKCNYLDKKICDDLVQEYDYIIGKLVNMSRKPEDWNL